MTDDFEKQRAAVRNVADRARKGAPVAGDSTFKALAVAKTGKPAMVYSPEKQPAFWIVPFLVGSAICGFARVELSNQSSQVSILGAGPEDRGSWIQGSFFSTPPSEALAAIRTRFSGKSLSGPFLSYDQTPARWAWRIVIEDSGKTTVFITPGGWYERTEGQEPSGNEGG